MNNLPPTITKARARLLVRAPFFGSIALGLGWVDAPEIGTMATDGRSIWFNLSWCEEQGVEKTMGVIAHEVLHVVNKHHLRRGDRDPETWNRAADLMINRVLEQDGYLLPVDGLFDREGRFAGLPTETIYARMMEESSKPPAPRQQTQQTQEGQGDAPPQHSPGGSSQPGGSPPEPSPTGGNGSGHDPAEGHDDGRKPVGSARNWGEVRDIKSASGEALAPAARSTAEHNLNVIIRQAAAAAKRAGKFPGRLAEIVAAATDNVDWRDKFRMSFDGTLRGEVSWARPNRRFIQHGIYLPGWLRSGAGRVAFVLDTSGSISARELAAYTAGVLGILEETGPEQIALIQCDTEVRDVSYLQPGESFDKITVKGRGGTRFQPAFDWIAESGFDPSAIVYATDLFCREAPTDPGTPVIWLTPTRGLSVSFGEIINITI